MTNGSLILDRKLSYNYSLTLVVFIGKLLLLQVSCCGPRIMSSRAVFVWDPSITHCFLLKLWLQKKAYKIRYVIMHIFAILYTHHFNGNFLGEPRLAGCPGDNIKVVEVSFFMAGRPSITRPTVSLRWRHWNQGAAWTADYWPSKGIGFKLILSLDGLRPLCISAKLKHWGPYHLQYDRWKLLNTSRLNW